MNIAYIFVTMMPLLLAIEPLLDLKSRHRKTNLFHRNAKKGIEALKNLSWQDFEHVCSGYFKSKGYKVTMTGLGGADNGMDLLITKNGKQAVVQCKHWKGRVGVAVVREMFGLMHAQQHEQVFIVALSGYTKAAKEWANGKPIRLISGYHLVQKTN